MAWRRLTATIALTTVGWTLACGGAAPVETDEALLQAEAARLEEDFKTAEAILRAKIEDEPDNARARKLWGDVNLTRGQTFGKPKVKRENMRKARARYKQAVLRDVTDCRAWARLGFIVAVGSEIDVPLDGEEPPVRVENDFLDTLPLAEGWKSCPGGGLLAIESMRTPDGDQVATVRKQLGKDATDYDIMALTEPWLVAAYQALDYKSLSWEPVIKRRPKPKRGGWFVIIDAGDGITAQGVAGATSRRIKKPYRTEIVRETGGDVVFVDRGFAKRVPSIGITRANDCPGTRWNVTGPDNVPTGKCKVGSVRRGGRLYDPDILRYANDSHYHHPSIRKAELNLAETDDAFCIGTKIGRFFSDTPTCEITYDKLISQQRKVPLDKGLVAESEDHAHRMMQALGLTVFYPKDVGKKLAEGQVAKGLPYDVAKLVPGTLEGCTGVDLFQSAEFVEGPAGSLQFTCNLSGVNYTFRDMELVSARPGRQ